MTRSTKVIKSIEYFIESDNTLHRTVKGLNIKTRKEYLRYKH